MEVRKGYKKTEVGVIPEDWDCIEFGDCVISSRLGGNYANDVTPSQFPLIKMGNIGRGNIILEKIEYVKNEVPNEKDRLNYGDLLFNTRNTLELVGKVAIWKNELPKAYYNSNLLHFVFDESYVASSFFINYMFNSKLIIDKLKEIATGTTSVAAIYSRDLYKIIIPIPPLSEQQAIAAALSDVDNLISSLTKLINKKINIKQGVMQELLTGKKRLEGFTGEWGKVRLGDVGKFISGSGFPLKYQSSKIDKYPFYKVSDFNNVGNGIYMKNANNYINEDVRITLSAKVIPKNAIIFAKIGAAIFLERKRIALYECCIDNNMMCFVSDSSIFNEKFAYYIFQNNNLSDFNNATALPSLNAKAIGELAILVPPTVIEQTAIANILSDMDAEIEALEQKLSKYKAIKQGMMHELLTGRIRLI